MECCLSSLNLEKYDEFKDTPIVRDVRSVSDVAEIKARYPIPFMHTVDADMIAYRQGKTRKGSYAAYMDVSHPDIMEFLSIRIPTVMK